nr:cupin domain-containing protein [Burkholderia cenocepacia]
MKTIDITTSKNLVHSYISNYMDVLTDITQTIRLKGGVDFRCEFSAPWGLEMQSGPVARFHIIVRGNCWLKLAGRPEWIQLHAGDLVVLLYGTGHCLVDAPGSNVVSAESVPHPDTPGDFVSVISGGGGLPATVLCGHFEFDREQDNYLLRSLPTLIHLRGTDTYEFEWLQTVHRFIADETLRARSGAVAVIQRLVEVLFIQMLRTYIAKSVRRPAISVQSQTSKWGQRLTRSTARLNDRGPSRRLPLRPACHARLSRLASGKWSDNPRCNM